MPYWSLHGQDEPAIRLEQVSPNAFQLLEGFRFQRHEGASPRVVTVPPHDPSRPPLRGNTTDLASVPWFLWWFISSHGRHTRAALVHDHLLTEPEVDRTEADLIFREALEESGVSWVRRWFMWAGVTLATRWDHGRLRLLLLVGQAVVSLAVTGSWLFGHHVSGWWALSLLAAGFGWGVLWPLVVGGLVLLGPPTLIVGVAAAAVYVVELVGNAVGSIRSREFELPRPVPYRNHRGQF